MTDRPILFSGPLVRAILDGTKTVTRRPVKPRGRLKGGTLALLGGDAIVTTTGRATAVPCPYGNPGDRLWVRETWRPIERASDMVDGIEFCADDAFVPIENTPAAASRWLMVHGGATAVNPERWRPSIHMPRWASRITLDVISVRAERLHDIDEEDARREGVASLAAFREAWDGIYGNPHGWDDNPIVWRVEFGVCR